MRKKTKFCRECGKEFAIEVLSEQGNCYDCALNRMIFWFQRAWSLKHKEEANK